MNEVQGSPPLSAVIITRDAATVLPACLDSLAFVQEILVVDSGSQDKTVALALARGARVLHQEWQGFGRQKQFAVDQARHDWVLCLDADERVTPELAKAITAALTNPGHMAYDMPRCNRFMNRWLRHGEGYPDYNLRLFHRRHARWRELPIHEHVVADAPPGRLQGDLRHESEQGLEAYLARQNRYTTLQARELARAGRPIPAWRLWLNPLARFVKFYLLRLGFLDGLPGLVHVVIGCHNTFFKYAKARELMTRTPGADGDTGPTTPPPSPGG